MLIYKGTRRNFIDPVENEIYVYDEDEGKQIICLKNFEAAWGIDAEALRVISKRYDIDFKIYAFEAGMEFNQDIEIMKGKIIKDEEIKFEDYVWECIEPYVGG